MADIGTSQILQLFKKPGTELNILILGETGVGKSTFINAFVNYVTFNTMEEAINSRNLVSLIKSSFVITDPVTMDARQIRTGSSSNEVLIAGESATQKSRVYRLEFKNGSTIRLIDTPGIGDVRGFKQDDDNFRNIINTIRNYDCIHGILILLKPNSARLSTQFRFCVTELLSHWYQSAKDAIAFGFTNTRSTFYNPGETYPALKQLIEDNQITKINLDRELIYCFDSDSFRFLAAVKNGCRMDGIDSFKKSWNRSVSEVKRLLQHFLTCKPHPVHDTMSLIRVRNTLTSLTVPLVAIPKHIVSNQEICDDKRRLVDDWGKYKVALVDKLIVEKIDIESKPSTTVTTVCAKADCVEVTILNGQKKTHYKTKCHEQCSCISVHQMDTVNNAQLMQCSAMNGNKCSKCGHDYQDHMFINYETTLKATEFVDPDIRAEFKKCQTDSIQEEKEIVSLTNTRREYENELKQFKDVAEKFAGFVARYAIVPCSDARLEYLDHLLREAIKDAQTSNDDSSINYLEDVKARFLEECKVIKSVENSGHKSVVWDPYSMAEDCVKLHQLPLFGRKYREASQSDGYFQNLIINEIAYKIPE